MTTKKDIQGAGSAATHERSKKKPKPTQTVESEKFVPKTIEQGLAHFTENFKGVEKKRENTYTNSMYASLDDVMTAIKKPLIVSGLMISQIITIDEFNDIPTQVLITSLMLLSDPSKSMDSRVILQQERETPQGFGSSLTYMRRYSVCCMLNIVETSDDDGQAAESALARNEMPATNQQEELVELLIEKAGVKKDSFMKWVAVSFSKKELSDLNYGEAALCVKALKSKINPSMKARTKK